MNHIHRINFNIDTTCSDPSITAFNIEIRDTSGVVLEAYTEASTESTVAGVTYTQETDFPSIVVDARSTTQDLDVVFVDFTTSCATTPVNQKTLVIQDEVVDSVAPVAPNVQFNAPVAGCAAFLNACSFQREGFNLDGVHNTAWEIWIGPDGKIYGIGPNNRELGAFGLDWQAQTNRPGDNNIFGGQRITEANVPFRFPNYEFYLPDAKFTKVRTTGLNTIVFALTDDGKLYTSGGEQNEVNDPFPAVTARPGVQDPAIVHTPFEIVPPSGTRWVNFYLSFGNQLANARIYAVTDEGRWYGWGRGIPGVYGFGFTDDESFAGGAAINTDVPTEILHWPVLPKAEAPTCLDDQRLIYSFGAGTGTTKIFIGEDGTVRFSNPSGAIIPLSVSDRNLQISGIIPLPDGITAEKLYVTPVSTIVIGSDGFLYYAGADGDLNPHGATGSNVRGSTFEGFRLMNQTVSGTTRFLKVQLHGQAGSALGDDGRIYVFNGPLPPTPIATPENNDIIDYWVDQTGEMIWKYSDGRTAVFPLQNTAVTTIATNMTQTLTNLDELMTGTDFANPTGTDQNPKLISCGSLDPVE